jgi:hypothetical protein
MAMKGMEKWRIAQAWGSFSYYDEPRSYYDPIKKDVIFYGQNKKRGRPSAKKNDEQK